MLRSAGLAAARFSPELGRCLTAKHAIATSSAGALTVLQTTLPSFGHASVASFGHNTQRSDSLLTRLYSTAGNSKQDTGFGVQRNAKVNVDAEQHMPGSHGFNPAPHPSYLVTEKGAENLQQHPVYTTEYAESIQPFHRPPKGVVDHLAYWSIQSVRSMFDVATRYGHGNMTREKWLTRMVFLETVAGVPGMVGGMIRHLHSLRLMRKDRGWIHTLLDEAENERMHLMTFMQMKQPGPVFRGMVLLAQGVFFNLFFLAYLASPKYCHRLVGYLEEEAVKTYTHAIQEIEAGRVPEWQGAEAVPDLARLYWRLPQDATVRDLMLAVRADEACHSHVNHALAGIKKDDKNPFAPAGEQTA